VWALENLVAGNLVNVIEVDEQTEAEAKVALQRMLELPGLAPAQAAKD
jgi:quinolinate synthase